MRGNFNLLKLILVTAFFAINFSSFAQARDRNYPSKKTTSETSRDSAYDLAPGVVESESFDFFMDLVQTTTSVTMEEFLAEWKQRDPLLFRFYLMSYRSRSLQSATPEAPRILLFNPITDFVASFNGHQAKRGSQNIETVRFNHKTDRFEFRELTFDNKNKPTLSEVNPKKCLECHQSLTRDQADPRPNWEPYFMWPGFYGSVDGKLVRSKNELSHDQLKRMDPSLDSIIFNELDSENKWFENFMATVFPFDSRYSILTPFDKDVAAVDARLFGTHARRPLRTVMFTQRIAQHNFKRVTRIMLEDAAVFDYLKEALVSVLHCPRRVQLPFHFIERHKQNSSVQSVDDIFALEFGSLIKLFFEPFYYDTDDWSMDFKTNGRLAFSHRFGTPGRPTYEISNILESKSKAFSQLKEMKCNKEFSDLLKKYEDPQIFEQLQQKRLAFKQRIEAVKQTPLIQRCINCHSSSSGRLDIPQIAFDDKEQLKQQLKRGGYKRGTLASEIFYRIGPHAEFDDQMPPQGLPPEQQRQDLINYINELKAENDFLEAFQKNRF